MCKSCVIPSVKTTQKNIYIQIFIILFSVLFILYNVNALKNMEKLLVIK